jgi:hypothetical protein
MAAPTKLTQPKIVDPFAPPKIPTVAGPTTGAGQLNGPNAPSTITGGPVAIKKSNIPAAIAATPASAVGSTSATPAAAPAAVAPAPAPFLTADQTDAFNQAWYAYQGKVNDENASLQNATTTAAQQVQQDAATANQNTETANNSAASRGLFLSSIRDGALNDIAATQVNNDNTVNGNLAALSSQVSGQLDTLAKAWGSTTDLYTAYGITNAQNATPVVPAASPSAAAPAQTGVNTSLMNAGAAANAAAKLGYGATNAGNAASSQDVAAPAPGASLAGAGSAASNKAVAKAKAKGK